jgi:hypothetical protein
VPQRWILAKNKLDSDFINQRLNGGAKPVSRSRAAEAASNDDGSAMTPGFIAGLLVLCIAVGGGTFYLAGSGGTLDDLMTGSTGPFVSAADGACKSMWVPNGKNSAALSCYLTTNVSRLCDPREKKHLARVMRSYRNDLVAYDSQMMMSGFKAVAIARSSESMNNMKIMSQSVARQSKNQDYRLSSAETKAFADHSKMVQKMEEAVRTPGIMGSIGKAQVSDEALAAKIRRLGTSGYMSKGDFGWFVDVLVTNAFDSIKVAGSVCKS